MNDSVLNKIQNSLFQFLKKEKSVHTLQANAVSFAIEAKSSCGCNITMFPYQPHYINAN